MYKTYKNIQNTINKINCVQVSSFQISINFCVTYLCIGADAENYTNLEWRFLEANNFY